MRSHLKQSHPITGPAAKVAALAAHVSIVDEKLLALAGRLASGKRKDHWLTAAPAGVTGYIESLALEKRLLFITVFHAAGFSYWGEPRWSLQKSGTIYNGAQAWLLCLAGQPNLVEPDWLRQLSSQQWQSLTLGLDQIPMPLTAERLSILQQLGSDWRRVEKQLLEPLTTGGEALDLAVLIGKQLPGFDDLAVYKEVSVPFLKRAQLLVADLNYLLVKSGRPGLAGLDKLTAMADYKIPQYLRQAGVLDYSPSLAAKVDNFIEIDPGSEEEIEIRACTVEAVERLKEALLLSGDEKAALNASQIDTSLWLASQHMDGQSLKPYHRCRTIYY